ncbi:hypothetical protein ABZ570_20465 [Micromonospora sp. NPDC007271]|uniref:hypothetical protein n=1 Tax=Micromonospora sp. NPDC007271 TaxID=3154587 RepID=UPI0033FC3FE5
MPTLEPVASPVAVDVVPFDLWPVASPDPAWLRLHGQMTPAEVGMAVWAILFGSRPVDEVPVRETPAAALSLLSDLDHLYLPGGFLVVDQTTGVTVEPGCCCDIGDWREWLHTLDGRGVFLGDYPSPEFEFLGDVVRVWTDDGSITRQPPRRGVLDVLRLRRRPEPQPAQPEDSRQYVDLDRSALPDLLRAAQHDLIGFLTVLRAWVDEVAPEQADRFVAAVDKGLEITAPLPR